MRRILLVLTVVGALAAPAAAAAGRPPIPAAPAPAVLTGGGDGNSGWTGCTQQQVSHGGGLPYAATVRHFLVVSYCKQAGIITSIGIAAHGCDATGVAFCHAGPAWLTGGGVGSGWATFEAHASWGVTVVPLYNNSDTLNLTVQPG